MAEVIKCDICGKECNRDSRYELIEYRFIVGPRKRDICIDCVNSIKVAIEMGKVYQEED